MKEYNYPEIINIENEVKVDKLEATIKTTLTAIEEKTKCEKELLLSLVYKKLLTILKEEQLIHLKLPQQVEVLYNTHEKIELAYDNL